LTTSGAGAGAAGGGGCVLSEQADTNAADTVTAQMSAKIFKYDFIGFYLTLVWVRLTSVDVSGKLVQGKVSA
jgi:hypothetical protein